MNLFLLENVTLNVINTFSITNKVCFNNNKNSGVLMKKFLQRNFLNKTHNNPLPIWIVIVIVSASFLFYASSSGITGQTLKNGNGCDCHGPVSSNVMVMINGPDTLTVNQTADYTVTISGGPLVRGGTNIAASSGDLNISTGLQKISGELTHTSPKAPVSGVVTFNFSYTAPSSTGDATLYANGNSVNFNGGSNGDEWNFAPDKIITVTDVIPVELTAFSAEAKDGNIYLQWMTATEINNRGFEVERKLNDENGIWNSVGFVQGGSTTTELSNYSFIDKNLPAGSYNYRLKQIDFDGSYTYYLLNETVNLSTPAGFELSQNYPNPFNPSTKIKYTVNNRSFVTLKVFDITGKEIAVLIEKEQDAGQYEITFNADKLAGGIYLYKLNAGDFSAVNKMIYLK